MTIQDEEVTLPLVKTQVEGHNEQGFNQRVVETQAENHNVQVGVPLVQEHNQRDRAEWKNTARFVGNNQRDRAEWGTARFVGPLTYSTCTILSIGGIFLILFPIGIFAFLCPCDKKNVYRVDGKYYDEHDNYLGDGNKVVGFRRLSFRPTGGHH
jgi:hypothetical protein